MRLQMDFYSKSALEIAPLLLGKIIVRNIDNQLVKFKITEVEAYCGEEDLACHASKGRTQRTEVMYHEGGKIYVYLIYGIHWMFNIVCSKKNDPQAILIRSVENISGPGRVGKSLRIDKSLYGVDLCSSNTIWIEEETNTTINYSCSKRIGIDYAGDIWKNKPWRFTIQTPQQ